MKFETRKQFAKIAGIYVIRKSGIVIYVGSTINLEKRFVDHRKQLRRHTHANTHLQRSYDNGPENFSFEPIEVFDEVTKEALLAREQWHINRHENLYNICRTAGSCLGVKHTEEVKQRTSERRLGKSFEDAGYTVRSDNSSGFVGVSFSKSKDLWRARCNLFGREYFLGYFDSPEKAYNARLVFLASSREAPGPLIRRDNTSGCTGVSFYKLTGKWRAFCYVGKKFKHLGFFGTKEEALRKKLEFIQLYGNDHSPPESK